MEQNIKETTSLEKYLKNTEILDFNTPTIKALINERGWHNLEESEKVKQIYNYVRDEIKFGYNVDDHISASTVLHDGYGQCNTKGNLFMARIPNRMHGFTIHKALQKGAITGIWYKLSPRNILHSWVEVYVGEKWFNLEGLILDKPYLTALQNKFSDCKTTFCGYGAYTNNFQEPAIDWNRNHTYIQKEGINQDFGLFDSPDELYAQHKQKFSPLKKWIFQNYVRHVMNKNVDKIRKNAADHKR